MMNVTRTKLLTTLLFVSHATNWAMEEKKEQISSGPKTFQQHEEEKLLLKKRTILATHHKNYLDAQKELQTKLSKNNDLLNQHQTEVNTSIKAIKAEQQKMATKLRIIQELTKGLKQKEKSLEGLQAKIIPVQAKIEQYDVKLIEAGLIKGKEDTTHAFKTNVLPELHKYHANKPVGTAHAASWWTYLGWTS